MKLERSTSNKERNGQHCQLFVSCALPRSFIRIHLCRPLRPPFISDLIINFWRTGPSHKKHRMSIIFFFFVFFVFFFSFDLLSAPPPFGDSRSCYPPDENGQNIFPPIQNGWLVRFFLYHPPTALELLNETAVSPQWKVLPMAHQLKECGGGYAEQVFFSDRRRKSRQSRSSFVCTLF